MQEQPQPQPKENTNPHIADLVIEDMRVRKELGIKRYGIALQSFNDRDALQDLYEELLDACVYIRQVIEEREDKEKESLEEKQKKEFLILSKQNVDTLHYLLRDAIEELNTTNDESDNILAVGARIGKATAQLTRASELLSDEVIKRVFLNQ